MRPVLRELAAFLSFVLALMSLYSIIHSQVLTEKRTWYSFAFYVIVSTVVWGGFKLLIPPALYKKLQETTPDEVPSSQFWMFFAAFTAVFVGIIFLIGHFRLIP